MRVFFLLALCVLMAACSDRQNDPLLNSGPYARITDSIRKMPRSADLYYRRGQLLYANGEFAAAKRDLRSAWSLQPREDIGLSLTTALRRESNDSAFVFLQSARHSLPQSVAFAIGLARAYQNKGDNSAALELCNNILQALPNQLDALSLKAELLDADGRNSEALQTLETAYSYAPFDVELVNRLGYAYAVAGNPRVLTLSDSLIALDRQRVHPEPYYFKALYFEEKGDTATAIRWLDEATGRDYNFLDAYLEKGQLLYYKKQYEAALKTCQLALTITPTYADGYYWMAKCQEAMGNKADAKTNYQRAYGLDKTNAEAKEAAERL